MSQVYKELQELYTKLAYTSDAIDIQIKHSINKVMVKQLKVNIEQSHIEFSKTQI